MPFIIGCNDYLSRWTIHMHYFVFLLALPVRIFWHMADFFKSQGILLRLGKKSNDSVEIKWENLNYDWLCHSTNCMCNLWRILNGIKVDTSRARISTIEFWWCIFARLQKFESVIWRTNESVLSRIAKYLSIGFPKIDSW